MVSHICLLVELGPICNSTAASLCLKSCVDHSLLKSYNGGLWKNIYRSGPYKGPRVLCPLTIGISAVVYFFASTGNFPCKYNNQLKLVLRMPKK